jgi:hypothetical protein
MRKALFITTLLVIVVTWSAAVFAVDKVSERTQSFYEAVSIHFKTSFDEISDFRDQGIAMEDLPVLFLLADRAKIPPDKIAIDRANGASWMSIAEDYGLGANTFYFMINVKFSNETYSPIFEKYRSAARGQGGEPYLTDNEIVNMVNLKFVSSVHDYNIFEIMAMRDIVNDFPRINELVKEAKAALLAREREERRKVMKASSMP